MKQFLFFSLSVVFATDTTMSSSAPPAEFAVQEQAAGADLFEVQLETSGGPLLKRPSTADILGRSRSATVSHKPLNAQQHLQNLYMKEKERNAQLTIELEQERALRSAIEDRLRFQYELRVIEIESQHRLDFDELRDEYEQTIEIHEKRERWDEENFNTRVKEHVQKEIEFALLDQQEEIEMLKSDLEVFSRRSMQGESLTDRPFSPIEGSVYTADILADNGPLSVKLESQHVMA